MERGTDNDLMDASAALGRLRQVEDKPADKIGTAHFTAATMADEIARLRSACRAALDSEETTLGDGGSVLGDDIRAMIAAALKG